MGTHVLRVLWRGALIERPNGIAPRSSAGEEMSCRIACAEDIGAVR